MASTHNLSINAFPKSIQAIKTDAELGAMFQCKWEMINNAIFQK